MALVYFIILIGIVVFVHELGHFLCAKAFDVKVLKFSLGFGPRLFGFQKGETEYLISALPFGGYVKMLGDDPNAVLEPEERRRSFYGQEPYRRFCITLAGPLMNLVFPMLLFFGVHAADNRVLPAVVGMVLEGDPADRAGIRDGDRIAAVNGEPIAAFEDLQRKVEPSAGRPLRITVEREGKRFDVTVTPKEEVTRDPLDTESRVGRIGVITGQFEPIIGVRRMDSPAGLAGLRSFDKVVSVNGVQVATFQAMMREIARSNAQPVRIAYLRPAASKLAPPFENVYGKTTSEAALTPSMDNGNVVTGIEPSSLYMAFVDPKGPAAGIGLVPGDRLVSIDGVPVRVWSELLVKLQSNPTKPHTLAWEHEGQQRESRSYQPAGLDPSQGISFGSELYEPGMRPYASMKPPSPVAHPDRFSRAFRLSIEETWDIARLTVLGIVRLAQGRISLKTIGGPILIGDLAGAAGSQGVGTFLWVMALISINIGLINLFPIPVLDGGHMLLSLIESARKKPMSTRTREVLQTVGLVLLLSLMALAMKNDLERYWPRIAAWFMGVFG